MASVQACIQPALLTHLNQIRSIFEHYVLNTTTTFCHNCPPSSVLQAKHEAAVDRGLPYLVALSPASDPTDSETVIGYAYAMPFRAPSLSYAPSVEVSIFMHPSHLRQGIGTNLMEALLSQLKLASHHASEPGYEKEPVDVGVRNVFAVVAHDINGSQEATGSQLIKWYEGFGFEIVGRLKSVGWKHERWIDTIYLQLAIHSPVSN